VLGGTSVTVGGKSAALFSVSPNQINLQIPWEISGQTKASLVVTTVAGDSHARDVKLEAVSPAIFTVNSTGSGQGILTVSSSGQLITPSTPVSRGEYITIYCSGLGMVSNTPSSGAAAGSDPVSNTATLPAVTIGGVRSSVAFSGLTPGFVGLNQVNAIIPASVTPGAAVSLVLEINGVASNTVTIAVR
jgi:uncharacterized protein (TIGR03437 family)